MNMLETRNAYELDSLRTIVGMMHHDDVRDVGAMQFHLVPHVNHILMLHGNSCSFFGSTLLVVHELIALFGVASSGSSTWFDGCDAAPPQVDVLRSSAAAASSCTRRPARAAPRAAPRRAARIRIRTPHPHSALRTPHSAPRPHSAPALRTRTPHPHPAHSALTHVTKLERLQRLQY